MIGQRAYRVAPCTAPIQAPAKPNDAISFTLECKMLQYPSLYQQVIGRASDMPNRHNPFASRCTPRAACIPLAVPKLLPMLQLRHGYQGGWLDTPLRIIGIVLSRYSEAKSYPANALPCFRCSLRLLWGAWG